MTYYYEFAEADSANLPVKATIYEVVENTSHWHKYMEITLVLSGSIIKRIGAEEFLLKAGEIAFVNSNEVHSTSSTEEANLLLSLQIDPKFYKTIYVNFDEHYYDCNLILLKEPNEAVINKTRRYIAQIVKEMVDRDVAYRSRLGSILFLLAGEVLGHSPFREKINIIGVGSDDDLKRLQRFMDHITENLHRTVTLKELADMEHLSYYYVSHFIKDKLGMTFQEYLNKIRLHQALHLLMYSGKNSEEISQDLGFKNLNAFTKLFKDEYGTAPSEYMKNIIKQHTVANQDNNQLAYKKHSPINIFYNPADNLPQGSRTYFDVDRINALEILFSYLEGEETLHISSENIIEMDEHSLTANVNQAGEKWKPYWRKLTTATRAAEGLREEWQSQLQDMQKEIGFEQIRFHGILSDDMMVYQTDLNGDVSYNWTYVDTLFDKLLAKNIRPFVELSFMPDDLKSNDLKAYWWGANISPPNDKGKWADLIRAFVKHLINRYGLAEVETWHFEVWNEPELENVLWAGSKADYFEFYKVTVNAISEISARIKVGGPAITHQALSDSLWLEDFLQYCKDNELPIDFVSLHIYPEYFPEAEEGSEIYESLTSTEISSFKKMQTFASLSRIYYDADITHDSLLAAREKIKNVLGYIPELCITEWNASASPRNLIHDTAFVATYIIHNVIKCIGLVDMLGYWTFTDINEEIPLGVSHFHGNYGLINKDGIKKASYFAYYLLAKLGDEILARGDNYIITKNDSGVQILTYNFTYFNGLFISGDTSLLTHKNRYKVFESKLSSSIKVDISGLEGAYKISRHKLNRQHGSAYDKWVEMGGIEEMTVEEINYLKNRAYPQMTVEKVHLEGNYQGTITLPVHGVELVEIRKMY